jgi:hypothetical protein
MSDPEKVADAFLCPRDYPHSAVDRDFARNTLFGPALGSDRVHSRFVAIMPEGRSLVTRISATEIDDTSFQYGKNDPRHPDMCHDWFVAMPIDTAPGFVAGDAAKPTQFLGHNILIGFKKDAANAS